MNDLLLSQLVFVSNKPKLTWNKTFQEHAVLMEGFHGEYELLFGFWKFCTTCLICIIGLRLKVMLEWIFDVSLDLHLKYHSFLLYVSPSVYHRFYPWPKKWCIEHTSNVHHYFLMNNFYIDKIRGGASTPVLTKVSACSN